MLRPRSLSLVLACAFLLAPAPDAAAQAPSTPPLPPPLPPQPVPAGNPITPDKALLGKTLFWDEQLSSTRMTACGSCHLPSNGMSDPRGAVHPGRDGVLGTDDDKVAASFGPIGSDGAGNYVGTADFGLDHQIGTRRALATINTGHFVSFFWDGRVEDSALVDPITGAMVLPSGAQLENTILQPPLNDFEMAHFGRDWNDVIARIESSTPLAASPQLTPDLAAFVNGKDYQQLYDAAFGTPDVTASRTAMAIATYLRTLVSDQSKFDAVIAGTATFTPQESAGVTLFNALCASCHEGPLVGGRPTAFPFGSFANTGVRPPIEDLGRAGVNGNPQLAAAFKIPSLRNVELRAPFFHNGQMATLRDVLDFYNRGGDFPQQQPPVDNLILPFNLAPNQLDQIEAFLRTLTDPRVANATAPFDRPALAAEAHLPTPFGAGTAGTGGLVPETIAFEPPYGGNDGCAVAVRNASGNSFALLFAGAPHTSGFLVGPITGHIDPLGAQLVATAVTNPAGYTTVNLPLPKSLAGLSVALQWVVADAGAPGFLSASDATTFDIY